ncbi:purine-binding chemotaxis protein CheW [Oculatella sp. LEGE 06141]|uniref:chemotaxis protein CheW n=1 Tax=Oculatella sp. LEGE 06141 TaxID=1828648 RepID=UPI00187E19CC|nr:chemotaxis protein CheW [Oculatella sp. LEGE 06141]MBE9181719.1 purine-binding chemotaxis protein CheW [Oculatella sp. LEGE 06141]
MNTSITVSPANRLHKSADTYLGDPYLCFQLGEQTQALFSMDQVQEVITIPAQQITPMPNMPACVLGLLSRRSRVMWVIDTAYLLMSQPVAPSLAHYEIIVIQVNQLFRQQAMPLATSHRHTLMGLVVQKIRGSRYFSSGLIQPPQDTASPDLASCLKGYLLQQDNLMLVLDAEALVRLGLVKK